VFTETPTSLKGKIMTNPEDATITVKANGSLQVKGATIIGADGVVITTEESVFLCRCGHSQNKPFCDGAHRAAGFEDSGCHAPTGS
jgi:CDGSH-type Zn-finger protein